MIYQLSITTKGKHSGKINTIYCKVCVNNKQSAVEYGKQLFDRYYFGCELISVIVTKV
jgi:hypothetical protein